MYSIYVRDILAESRAAVRVLAIDVSDRETAESLVRGIATSYPVHLESPNRSVFWFKDKTGAHEIWCDDDVAAHGSMQAESPRGTSARSYPICRELLTMASTGHGNASKAA